MKKNTIFLSLAITLIVFLLAFSAYMVYKYKDTLSFMQEEKRLLTKDLDEMIDSYNLVLSQKDSLNTQLLDEKYRVERLRDSLSYLDATLDLVRRYRRQVRLLKKQKKELFRLADSLDRANQILIAQRGEIESKFIKERELSQNLKNKNEKLTEKVQEIQKIKIKDIVANAIIVEGDGAVVVTSRARLADKFRICMTFSENQFVKSGRKNVYVVVVSPEERILGLNETAKQYFELENGEERSYSAYREIIYENEDLEACVYVKVNRSEMVKGVYLCAVYVGRSFIGETELKLN